MNKVRIAYVPSDKYSPNIGYDARNFILYAKYKKIQILKFESTENYDFLILPPSLDISNIEWLKKRKEKIIYQLVDDYFSENNLTFKNYFRGLYKFVIGQNKKIIFNYKKQLIKICKFCNIIICSSEEQKTKIDKYNKNVYIFFEGNFKDIDKKKEKFNINESIKLVWEGRCENISTLKIFEPILKKLLQKYKIELHIISDYEIFNPYLKILKKNTIKVIKNIFKKLFSTNTTFEKTTIFFHQWHISFSKKIIRSCDIAIIPLNKDLNFESGKSQNKLIMFMKNNIPVLTSKIPSYVNIYKSVGINHYCDTTNEWVKKIEKLISSENLRKSAANKAYKYVMNKYSKQKFIKQWDNVLKK